MTNSQPPNSPSPESLNTLLTTRRAQLVDDLVTVIDTEVAEQRGISGTAVKAAYAAAQKVKPGVVRNATNHMLPDFLAALDPFWRSRPSDMRFGDHLRANGDAVAEGLLEVTDEQAASAKPALSKAYQSLRGRAKTYVISALPRLGAAIEANAAQ